MVTTILSHFFVSCSCFFNKQSSSVNGLHWPSVILRVNWTKDGLTSPSLASSLIHISVPNSLPLPVHPPPPFPLHLERRFFFRSAIFWFILLNILRFRMRLNSMSIKSMQSDKKTPGREMNTRPVQIFMRKYRMKLTDKNRKSYGFLHLCKLCKNCTACRHPPTPASYEHRKGSWYVHPCSRSWHCQFTRPTLSAVFRLPQSPLLRVTACCLHVVFPVK